MRPQRSCFSFWLGIGYHSVFKELFFRINLRKYVALVKSSCKSKSFMVSCDHVLEPCHNFRSLKWDINFSLRSKITDFGPKFGTGFELDWTPPPKTLGTTSPPPPGKYYCSEACVCKLTFTIEQANEHV